MDFAALLCNPFGLIRQILFSKQLCKWKKGAQNSWWFSAVSDFSPLLKIFWDKQEDGKWCSKATSRLPSSVAGAIILSVMKWPKFILNDNAFSCRWKKHQIWSRELSCWTVNPGTQSIQELSHQSFLLQKTHFLHFPSYPKRVSKTCISSHRHFSSRSGEAAHFPGMKTLCMSVLLWGMIVETVPKDVFLLSGHWCRTLTIRDQSFGKDIRGVFAESGDTLYLLWWLESSPDKQGLCFFLRLPLNSHRESWIISLLIVIQVSRCSSLLCIAFHFKPQYFPMPWWKS